MKNGTNFKISIDSKKVKLSAREDYCEPGRKLRIYLFPAKETVWENFNNRRQRPRDLWRKIALQTLEKFGYNDLKIVFSQKAGCTCGCSPGFIANVKNGKEIFIDYTLLKR
ncbi:MAG: hypothetical protein WCT77_01935 [Bacteroidota bacterium]|jgi:hypothetical protein